jgi:large subunit ribosomal protein L7A
VLIYSRCFPITFRIGGHFMSYDRVKQLQSRIIIGTKQTIKAINNGEVEEVFIAKDVDRHITDKVLEVAKKQNIPCTEVDSKKKLGEACGIDVNASTVAIKVE